MTSRPRTSTASVPRRAALVALAGALVGSSLLTTSPARADGLRTGPGASLCTVVEPASGAASSVAACAGDPAPSTGTRSGEVERLAAASVTAAVADSEASGSSSYAWLGAIGFVLLVVGSVGRIVGLRIMYKNRKNKNL